jgi:hypothetical protein
VSPSVVADQEAVLLARRDELIAAIPGAKQAAENAAALLRGQREELATVERILRSYGRVLRPRRREA